MSLMSQKIYLLLPLKHSLIAAIKQTIKTVIHYRPFQFYYEYNSCKKHRYLCVTTHNQTLHSTPLNIEWIMIYQLMAQLLQLRMFWAIGILNVIKNNNLTFVFRAIASGLMGL